MQNHGVEESIKVGSLWGFTGSNREVFEGFSQPLEFPSVSPNMNGRLGRARAEIWRGWVYLF